SARTQPLSVSTTVIGSRTTIASSIAASSCSGASAKSVRRLPSGVFLPNLSRSPLICADRLPLLLLGLDQLFERFLLGAKLLVLLADLHLLELAQVAQPHVEDRVGLHVGQLERLHQHRLRLVLVADDLDDTIEVEIRDQIA